MSSIPLRRLAARLAGAIAALMLAALALPAAAKTMFYVPESYGEIGAWYAVLNSNGTARLAGHVGAQKGTYTDSGTEILVTLSKPLSFEATANGPDCHGNPFQQRFDTHQVLFRRVDGTGVNKGKSQVVEIGTVTDLGGCTPGAVSPFGSVSDSGTTMFHRAAPNRDPMTDVTTGLTIAGFREPARPDPYSNPFAEVEADVSTFDTATTLRFHRSGSVVNANMDAGQWLVLQLPSFQRAYTRFSINTSNGTETWLEAEWKDGKPQSVTHLLMRKPVPGTTFGTLAQTARMWESMIGFGTDLQNFVFLYRNYTGDRVQKDLSLGTESRAPITWGYDGADVVMTRMVGGGTTLSERRWTPIGRSGKYLTVMEREVRTPSGGSSFVYVPARVIFYFDRGAAYPPAP